MRDLRISTSVDTLLLAALEHGGDANVTGRFIVTFKEGAAEAGAKSLSKKHGLRAVNARDFEGQAFTPEETGDADALVLPAIGVALVSGEAGASIVAGGPIHSIDPEYFMFANDVHADDYVRGLLHMADAMSEDLDAEALGVTKGLALCKVPPSVFSGSGIRVAVLDTGFDLSHPEFAGRTFVTNTFSGAPVTDLNGHGTHITGTACGPKSPPGTVPRYGIGFLTEIYVGKVLTNSGAGTQAQVLAGMNWAVASKCAVILVALGGQAAVQPSYTAAGAAALANGGLMIAAAGGSSNRPLVIAPASAPANSPTVVSVGAVASNLNVASFSPGGKIDIVAPGISVLSAWPRPALHNTTSGASQATAHVAGCAALWAQTSAALRGTALRAKLFATAKRLPFPASDVGAGLVQAP